jgi:hypothetical protein
MRQIAVLVDGTGPHELGVYVINAENETEALEKVAEHVIKHTDPDCGPCEATEVDNFCSPTYQCQILNGHGSILYQMRTAPVMLL